MENFNFEILSNDPISTYLKNKEITNFISTVHLLSSSDNDLKLLQEIVVPDKEGKMTNASKILTSLAVENQIEKIELMMCIFLVDAITFPELETYFKDKTYSNIALTTSFLKIKGTRCDFSTDNQY